MAFRRSSSRLAAPPATRPRPQSEQNPDARSAATPLAAADTQSAIREWPVDETAFLRELLRCHGLSDALLERLMELATAPPNVARIVDRLGLALAAHLHFLPLEGALRTPILLYGAPGSGVSTIAAKLAARFDEEEILVVTTDSRNTDERGQLQEALDVLGLPLAVATDAASLRSTVARANGRKVIVDTACGVPSEQKCADQIRKFIDAAGAEPMYVLAADAPPDLAHTNAAAAARIGTRRMIVTRLDAERYIGAVLVAADAGQLALVAASVTPHFSFGLRGLTPENLARRLMAAALRAERWRIAPL
jgi:flagellar biosynthesis protein FlhF